MIQRRYAWNRRRDARARLFLARALVLPILFGTAAAHAVPDPNWTAQFTQADCVDAGQQGAVGCYDYAADLYENLDYSSAQSARTADISNITTGYDADYYYVEHDFLDAWNSSYSTGHAVVIELDVDAGGEADRGDYFIGLYQKSEFDSSNWVDASVDGGYESYRDPNDDVGGSNPLVSDFGGSPGNGYNGNISQAADRVWARIVNGNFQIAIRRTLVGNSPTVRLRSWSRQSTGLDKSKLYFHDHQGVADVNQIDNLAGLGTDQWIPVGDGFAGNHFAISHSGVGDVCTVSNVVVAAHDATHAVNTAYAGTITLSTTTSNGDWSLVNGTGVLTNNGNGDATYAFVAADNGTVTLGLSNPNVETLNIDVSDSSESEDPAEDADLTFTGAGTETLRDEINAVSYSGSDGTLAWSTSWLEINEGDGAGAGDERVANDLGQLRLRVRDNDGGGEGVQREADLSAYTVATLSFLYRRQNLDDAGDYVTVEVSSNGGSTWTELDRFAGPGTDAAYTAVNYDISAYIAANTRVRFLGSPVLGNSDRVWFDDVEIAVNGGGPACGMQLQITVAANASTCVASSVTVQAQDGAGDPLTGYTGTIDLTTSTNNGNWLVTAGSGTLVPDPDTDDDGAASYAFVLADAGSVTFDLSNAHADDLTITAEDVAAGISATTGVVSFRDNAFVITNNEFVYPVAGRDHAFDVTLWQRDTSLPTPDCQIATGYNGVQNLDGWYDPGASHPAGANAPMLEQGGPAFVLGQGVGAATPVNLNFTNGVAGFNLRSTDVGQYFLNLRDDTANFATETISGASGELTVRPFGFAITGIAAAAANPGGTAPGDPLFNAAGDPFRAQFAAVLYGAGDPLDANGNPMSWIALENNASAPSFAWDTQLGAVLNTPPAGVGGVAGVLDRPGGTQIDAADFTLGSSLPLDLRYSEVGSMFMSASANNYHGVAGLSVQGQSQAVGRFSPFEFTVTGTPSTYDAACNAFTYLGQPFDYSAGARPVATITAVNAQGATTLNYFNFGAPDDWWLLGDLVETYADPGGNLIYSGVGASHNSSATPTANGQVVVTFLGTLTYPRALPYADGLGVNPFNAAPALSFTVTDPDGVTYNAGAAFNFAITEAVGQNSVRHGRLRLQSAHGSEVLDLPAPLTLQTFDGINFTTTANDNCTAVGVADFTYVGVPIASAVTPFAAGDGSLDWLCSAASPCATGFVDVTGALAGAGLDWLRYDWDGDNVEEEPRGRVTFGIHAGANRNIHIREVF